MIPVRLELGVTLDTVGGPRYSTDVAGSSGAGEARNANWSQSRGRWELGDRVVRQSELDYIMAAFHVAQGSAESFLFKDWSDYRVAQAAGVMVRLTYNTWALFKRYTFGGFNSDRRILHPVVAECKAFVNGAEELSPVFSATAGTVTLAPRATRSIVAMTTGATTTIEFDTAFPGGLISPGDKIYVSGTTGSAASAMNGRLHTVTAVSGPNVTVSTNTTGLSSLSGAGSVYPQDDDTLSWSGQFDVAVRFGTDELLYKFAATDLELDESLYDLNSLPLLEVQE